MHRESKTNLAETYWCLRSLQLFLSFFYEFQEKRHYYGIHIRPQLSNFAIEGTNAHTLCEYYLKLALGIETENPIENMSYYNEEMDECARLYVTHIIDIVNELKSCGKDVSVLIERRLDYSRFVAEGFGTGDCLIIADDEMHVIDYKHGRTGLPGHSIT